MCGKLTAMVSWGEIYEYSSMFTRPDKGGVDDGDNDEVATYRVNGLVPVMVWDAEARHRRVVRMRWGFPHPKEWRRPQPIADGLRYAGTVENGFSTDDLARFERELPPAVVARAPLVQVPKGKSGAKWTRPALLVEVSYPNEADDGRLRHPRFKGFRDDLLPKAPPRRRRKMR